MRCGRLAAAGLVSLGLVAGSACGPAPDLATLKLLPGIAGYYDAGPMPNGENHLVPSVTFQLRNEGDIPMTNIDLSVSFWRTGDDGERDAKEIRAIQGTALEPGATGESITVRSSYGYTSPHARAEFFGHSTFKDFAVRIFAKHRGRMTKIGEIPVDRQLLPAAPHGGGRP